MTSPTPLSALVSQRLAFSEAALRKAASKFPFDAKLLELCVALVEGERARTARLDALLAELVGAAENWRNFTGIDPAEVDNPLCDAIARIAKEVSG